MWLHPHSCSLFQQTWTQSCLGHRRLQYWQIGPLQWSWFWFSKYHFFQWFPKPNRLKSTERFNSYLNRFTLLADNSWDQTSWNKEVFLFEFQNLGWRYLESLKFASYTYVTGLFCSFCGFCIDKDDILLNVDFHNAFYFSKLRNLNLGLWLRPLQNMKNHES